LISNVQTFQVLCFFIHILCGLDPFKNSDLYDLTNLQNKLKFVKEKIEESE